MLRVPLPRDADVTACLRHRQAMVNANYQGFRPNYMEHVLVSLSEAKPELLLPDESGRMRRKRLAKAAFAAKNYGGKAERIGRAYREQQARRAA